MVIESDASFKGWGVNLRNNENGWGLECERSSMPYQPPGVEGSLLGYTVLSEAEIRSECVLHLDNHIAIAYLNHMGGIYDLSMLSSS